MQEKELKNDGKLNIEIKKWYQKRSNDANACCWVLCDKIAKKLNKIKNLSVTVNPVKSEYWGRDITVSGLITTEDLIRTVKDIDADLVIIPSVMLKPYSEDFLDGKTLSYVKEQTGRQFFVVEDIYSMKELCSYLNKIAVAI